MGALAHVVTAVSIAVAIAGLTVAAPMAAAQDTNIRRILSPEETRQCICEQAEIEQLQAKVAETDPVQQEFDRLDKIIENARPNIDTSDPAEVDSFRRLYNRREDLRLQLQARRGPYNAQLGGMVNSYNARCANARMLKINVDAVTANPNACAAQ